MFGHTISELIVVACVAVLVFGFRCACLMVLNARSVRDYASDVAKANQLGFLEVKHALKQSPRGAQLDPLAQRLEHDYRLLTYLLRHGPAFQALRDRAKQRLVMLNFQLLKASYAFTRTVLKARGRRLLEEMTQVVGYLANQMGARAASLPGH